MPRGFRARGFFAISTSSGTMTVRDQYDTLLEMEREPARQQHDLDRHHRHRAPRHLAEQRELDAGEDVARAAPPRAQDRRARPHHMRRVGRVARRLQREIGLDAGGQVEIAAVEQRPAAMLALDGAQILRQRRLDAVVDLAEIMLQQDVFGRDGRIGLELEGPMAVGALLRQQRLARASMARSSSSGTRASTVWGAADDGIVH